MLRSAILMLLAAVALFAVSPGSSLAQPILPHRFSGTATLDGTSIVNGSVIEAIVDGATVASTTISGDSYVLDVVQPENGSFAGKAITFVVLGVVADQTATWAPFEVTVLNLTASTPLPPAPEDDDDDDSDSGTGSDGGGSVGGGGEPSTPPGPTPLETVFRTLSAQLGGRMNTGTADSVEASVEMPPGAITQNTGIQIESISAADPALPTLPLNTFSRVFRFSPAGLEFLIPITLIISYDESEVSGIDENTFVPILLIGSNWVTVKNCVSDDPLLPDPCLANRDIVNNKFTIKTTHFSTYGVQRAVALPVTLPIVSTELGLAIEPLEDNLVRVWHFDNSIKTWSFFDPRPGFVNVNTLTVLVNKQIYLVKVVQDQRVNLNGKARTLLAGWNYIVW